MSQFADFMILVLLAGLAQAATTSRLRGTVIDNEGAALPGVTVTISSPPTTTAPGGNGSASVQRVGTLLAAPTPTPTTKTRAGGIVPAGVDIIGNALPLRSAAVMTAA